MTTTSCPGTAPDRPGARRGILARARWQARDVRLTLAFRIGRATRLECFAGVWLSVWVPYTMVLCARPGALPRQAVLDLEGAGACAVAASLLAWSVMARWPRGGR